MPGRTYSAGTGYRYGFNGKENDNEVKGTGNVLDYGARIYDPRIGRWLSVDPLMAKFPNYSPYAYVKNSPIFRYDHDGKTDYTATVKSQVNKDGPIIKTVTVDIVYAIINLSSKEVYNSSQMVGGQDNDETFSTSLAGKSKEGKNVTVNVITNIHYRLASKVADVRQGENIALVVDDIRESPGEKNVAGPVGMANLGGDIMSVEYSYLSDRGLVRHEQGHNLGFQFYNNPDDPAHSKTGYMNANSATGKNLPVGKTPSEVINAVFSYFLYAKDGKVEHDSYKGTDIKTNAQDFINKVNLIYDQNKAKKAGFE